MPCTSTPNENTIPPTHEDFRWIHGPGKDERFADFIELTRDISAGVSTCLQIIFRSELVRETNLDSEPEQASQPPIGKTDSANLLRLSLAATTLLRQLSDERIERLNQRPAQ